MRTARNPPTSGVTFLLSSVTRGARAMASTRRPVIGYVRVSTAEQAATGFGLEVQRRAIRAFCKAKHLRLLATLADEGESGSNGLDRRQGLAQVLARVEAGEAEALVVYRL